MHAGKYEQAFGQAWQIPSITTGNELVIVDAIIKASGDPAFLDAQLNREQSFGRVGWLANAGAGSCASCTASQACNANLPVSPWVREDNVGAPNSCATPKAVQTFDGVDGGILLGD